MFKFDIWHEIFSSMKRNKLRTFLTGFAVAWGIFMLILLLGAGNGISNGMMSNFRGRLINSVSVWGDNTTIPYKGLPNNRRITFDERDLTNLRHEFPEIGLLTAVVHRSATITYKTEYSSINIQGVYPDHSPLFNLPVLAGKGRFINQLDIRSLRKVIIINDEIRKVLFRDEDPMGKFLTANGIAYQVVGIYEQANTRHQQTAYIPFSTAQLLYNKGYGVGNISMSLNGLTTKEANEDFNKRLRGALGRYHQFDPNDMGAVYIYNSMEDYLQTFAIFQAIGLFVWVIGVFTLFAGIIGVSNIMLVSVRERTREFGIRKALGAPPTSIIKLIVYEAILVTGMFGYVGMLLGIGLTELANTLIGDGLGGSGGGGQGMTILKNPTVDLNVVLIATATLVVAGVLAGYFPARKAVQVTAIEAMRKE